MNGPGKQRDQFYHPLGVMVDLGGGQWWPWASLDYSNHLRKLYNITTINHSFLKRWGWLVYKQIWWQPSWISTRDSVFETDISNALLQPNTKMEVCTLLIFSSYPANKTGKKNQQRLFPIPHLALWQGTKEGEVMCHNKVKQFRTTLLFSLLCI